LNLINCSREHSHLVRVEVKHLPSLTSCHLQSSTGVGSEVASFDRKLED
jgi:hypothetical protein